jgi:molybdopterin synthase catalytic subunit
VQRALDHASATIEAQAVYCRVLAPGEFTSAAELANRIGFPECGAMVTFEGIVRSTEYDKALTALDYEFHPVMAERELKRLCQTSIEKFAIQQIACEHCTGRVAVGVVSVAIAVGASHRGPAFAACQYVLDQLKMIVPIWKNPVYEES